MQLRARADECLDIAVLERDGDAGNDLRCWCAAGAVDRDMPLDGLIAVWMRPNVDSVELVDVAAGTHADAIRLPYHSWKKHPLNIRTEDRSIGHRVLRHARRRRLRDRGGGWPGHRSESRPARLARR